MLSESDPRLRIDPVAEQLHAMPAKLSNAMSPAACVEATFTKLVRFQPLMLVRLDCTKETLAAVVI